MKPTTIDFAAPVDVQIAQARAQGIQLAPAYYAMAADKRAQAFTVSGLARLDQVQAVADALAKSQANGDTFADFKKWANTQDWALPRHRLETIYRNSVQTAYNAGHWREFEENAKNRPFLMYDAINDSRVRPSHLALDGIIKPVGDVFWKTHSAPLGHRCRCVLRSLSRDEAMRRGGVTQNPPAEGVPDAGWGHTPTDGFRGLINSIENRLSKCRVNMGATFAKARNNAPMWCTDGPARNQLLMQQAWAERKGAMPEPRALVVEPVPFVSPQQSFERFMQALGSEGNSVRVALPSGDVVQVSDDLFRTLDGRWKINKRGRDEWLLYLAALIQSPQEVWRLKLAQTEELYLLGRFQRGRQRIDALAVFKRNGDDGLWREGKTAYTLDDPKGMDKKRAEIMKSSSLVFVEM